MHIVNTWTGPNGYGTLELPAIAESHGRTIQIHSDSTISANTFVRLIPSSSDTGVTIDGGTSYSFNRAYDGITILGNRLELVYNTEEREIMTDLILVLVPVAAGLIGVWVNLNSTVARLKSRVIQLEIDSNEIKERHERTIGKRSQNRAYDSKNAKMIFIILATVTAKRDL